MEVIFLEHTSSNDRRMLALFEKKKYMKEKTRALTKLMSPSLLTMPQVQWKRFAAMVRSLVDSHYVCWVLLADCAGSARPWASQHPGQDPKVHTLVKRLQCCRESSKKKKITHSLRVSVQTIVFTLTGLHLLLIPGVSSSFWYPLPSPL